MKERLFRFLNSVANLNQSQQPVLAAAGTGTTVKQPASENIHLSTAQPTNHLTTEPTRAIPEGLTNYPPIDRWDDWVEYDSKAWPKKVPRRYMLIPTVCFNCESACGLLAYVDKETLEIQKFEGNPVHPGSRGRNCAKGPATKNQIYDPERILYPLKRVGQRGEGKWQRVTWDEVLDDIAGRMRKAILPMRLRW